MRVGEAGDLPSGGEAIELEGLDSAMALLAVEIEGVGRPDGGDPGLVGLDRELSEPELHDDCCAFADPLHA